MIAVSTSRVFLATKTLLDLLRTSRWTTRTRRNIARKGDGQGDRVALSLLRSATSEGDLHAFVAQRLAPFKVARYIEMVAVLPLTWSKKIAKAQLKASRSDRIVGSGDTLHRAS